MEGASASRLHPASTAISGSGFAKSLVVHENTESLCIVKAAQEKASPDTPPELLVARV